MLPLANVTPFHVMFFVHGRTAGRYAWGPSWVMNLESQEKKRQATEADRNFKRTAVRIGINLKFYFHTV